MKQVQFSAQIMKVESKVDKTLNLKLNTQELPPEEAGILYGYSGLQVWVGIADIEDKLDKLDIPEFIPEFKGEKSHSQRVKELLWLVWNEKTDKKKTSRQFYEDYMEKLISNLKDKLD